MVKMSEGFVKTTDQIKKTFMDLNKKCLDTIFSKLDENDLARASEVCKRFQEQAALTAPKFSNKKLLLTNRTPVESLRMLRCFGDFLQKVFVELEYEIHEKFFNKIIGYCGLTITEIDLCYISYQCRNFFSKDVFLQFPNLRRLNIDRAANVDPTCIEGNFPSLEHLSLGKNLIKLDNLKRFSTLNPQLKSLELTYLYGMNLDFFAFIVEKLPELEHFGFSIDSGILVEDLCQELPNQQTLLFMNLRSLQIREGVLIISNSHCGFADAHPYLQICNTKLEEMEVDVNHCSSDLVDLICQYQNLKKLTFKCNYGMNSRHLSKIDQLTKLSEIKLSGYFYCCYIDYIITFIKNSKHLKRIYLHDLMKGKDILVDLGVIEGKLNPHEWEVIYKLENRSLEIRRLRQSIDT